MSACMHSAASGITAAAIQEVPCVPDQVRLSRSYIGTSLGDGPEHLRSLSP